jgi:hypothetical protein
VMVLSITHYRHAGDNDITRERSRWSDCLSKNRFLRCHQHVSG